MKMNQIEVVQTPNELIRVVDEWMRHFVPSDFLDTHNNGKRMVDYNLDNFGSVSITGLTQAYEALKAAGVLDLKPAEPPAPVLSEAEKAAAFQKREFIRHQKDQLENSEAAFFERVKRAEEAKKVEKEAQEQKAAEVALNNEILRYECYSGPNRVDHGRSDAFRKDLFKIEVTRNGKRDAKLTLAAVREAISNMP